MEDIQNGWVNILKTCLELIIFDELCLSPFHYIKICDTEWGFSLTVLYLLKKETLFDKRNTLDIVIGNISTQNFISNFTLI